MKNRLTGFVALVLAAAMCFCSLPAMAGEGYEEYDDYEAYDYSAFEEYAQFDSFGRLCFELKASVLIY